MSILNDLSSQTGGKGTQANLAVVDRCLAEPAFLEQIAEGLSSVNDALSGDCAEVLTHVAEKHPDLVSPYGKLIPPLLERKTTRVRWEAMHALAFISGSAPKVVGPLLPRLREIIKGDASIIVRDYAVDAVAHFAESGRNAAQSAYPLLVEALDLWEGRHAGHALGGLVNVAKVMPDAAKELRGIAKRFSDSGRGVVRKAAKALAKAVEIS